MTKDKLMTYTFVALVVIAAITAILLWNIVDYKPSDPPFTQPLGWQLGLTVVLNCLVAVGVAVGVDVLFSKLAADSKLNIMSAAVFGMIVALSYSIGIPPVMSVEVLPLVAPASIWFVALISLVGMVVFKKVVGVFGRKFVNPAAAAKFVIFLPFLAQILLPVDHTVGIPKLATSINFDLFGFYMQSCFGNPTAVTMAAPTPSELFQTMFLNKYHGWAGGISTIAVIAVGIALFLLCRRFIKWRITVTYLVTTAVLAYILAIVYGGDPLLRLMFHLFVGSSIFMAFFMATDPASTPLTYMGQTVFGVGLGVLTVLIQTGMNFFGGSILALLIMNLLSPLLDKVGRLKPSTETKEPKLPKAKQFPPEKVKEYQCIRCGACMRVCCHKLSPILIKQAFDKQNVEAMIKLKADYCTGCGHCTFICPSRIDLRASVLRAKGMLRQEAA